VAFPAANERLV